MRKNILAIVLCLVAILVGCRNNPNIIAHFKSKYIKSENKIPYFQCDSFIMNPLGFELKPKIFENYYPGYFNKSLEILKNLHDPDVHDTLISFTKNNTLVQFLNTSEKSMLLAFNTDDSIVFMVGNIRIGLTKNKFYKIFDIKTNVNDTCEIGNMEGTSKFRFIFSKNRLTHISYLGYTD